MRTNYSSLILAFTIAVLATALTASGVFSASNSGTEQTRAPLQGKAPVCGGTAFVPAPGGIIVPGSNSVVVQVGTAGIVYVATFLDSPAPCPGPPASISVLTSDSSTCGSSEAHTIEVVDQDGFNVKDDTSVSVTSTLGSTLPGKTRGGLAVISLLLPSKASGVTEVTVAAGDVSARKLIEVTCG